MANQRYCSDWCLRLARSSRNPHKQGKFNKLEAARVRREESLTALQKEFLYGHLLGDGNASINQSSVLGVPVINITQCEEQREYAQFKMDLMRPFVQMKNLRRWVGRPTAITDADRVAYTATTIAHQDFLPLYTLFYKSGRKSITRELLAKLTPTSLLVWYLDDGSKLKDSVYRISTPGFNTDEHFLIKEGLAELFGVTPSIDFSEGQPYQIRFKKDDSTKVTKVFQASPLFSLLPACVSRKILANV